MVQQETVDPVGRDHAVRDDGRQALRQGELVVVVDGGAGDVELAVGGDGGVQRIAVPAHPLPRHGPEGGPQFRADLECHGVHAAA